MSTANEKIICFLEMSESGPNNNHKGLFMNNTKCDFYYVTFIAVI